MTSHRQLLWLLPLLGFILYLNTFYILDSDFWWHITAGRVMWETGGLIQTDPFAFTRIGLPYLAVHEWLAQVILFGVHALTGPTGSILLRGLLMAAVAMIVLAIDRSRIWPNVLIAALLAVAMRPGFLERPQMFSAVLYALSLYLIFSLLRDPQKPWNRLRAMIGIQIVWVNMHGAAALIALVPLGALGLEIIGAGMRDKHAVRDIWSSLRPFVITGLLLIVSLLISPSTIDNLTYVWNLLSDNTIGFIREWNPRPWSIYLQTTLPLWILAIAAVWYGKTHVIACSALLLIFGYLSRDAARHELLLVITLASIAIYQLRSSSTFSKRWNVVLGIILICIVAIQSQSGRSLLAYHGLLGFGSFEPAGGAVDFVEEHNITGNTYNNYGIGGYLLYRGYPDRKIFVDGRNVDYGYPFLEKAIGAAQNEVLWEEIGQEWDLTAAILTFDASKPEFGPYPFTHLHRNLDWAMVYIDDHAAVYLKKVPEHEEIIRQYQYLLLRPEYMDRDEMFRHVEDTQALTFEDELVRSIEQDDLGVKAILNLAKLYRLSDLYDKAIYLLNEGIRRKPMHYELYQEYAAVLVKQEHWAEAGKMYEKAIQLARFTDAEINYEHVATVFERAGNKDKALDYMKKSM